MLGATKCPREVIRSGWNCRCPLIGGRYRFPSLVHVLPPVPHPGPLWLVEGKYHVEIRAFEGVSEVMCYRVQMQVHQRQ